MTTMTVKNKGNRTTTKETREKKIARHQYMQTNI